MIRRLLDTNNKQYEVLIRSSIYIATNILYRGLGLLLLPILIATFTAEEFSRYGLMTSAVTLMVYLFSLNIHLAPVRLFFDYEASEQKSSLLFTSLISAILTSFTWITITFAILLSTNILDPVSLGDHNIQALVVITVLFTVGFQFAINLMRIKGDVGFYATILIAQRVSLIVGYISLNFVFQNAFINLIIALAGSTAFGALVGLIYGRKYLRGGKFNRLMLQSGFSYAWPTVVHGIAIWTIISCGRWIGTIFISLEELAPYTLVVLFFSVVSMLSRALFEARIPDIGSSFAKQDFGKGMRVINLTAIASALVSVSVFLGIYILLFVLRIRLPAQYMPTPALLLAAAAASIIDSVYLRGIQMLSALKRTDLQASVSVIAGGITVLLSFVLGSRLKDLGLVIAFCLGLTFLALASNFMSKRTLSETLDSISQ